MSDMSKQVVTVTISNTDSATFVRAEIQVGLRGPVTEVLEVLAALARCQGCEDAPLGQHTGPHDWETDERSTT